MPVLKPAELRLDAGREFATGTWGGFLEGLGISTCIMNGRIQHPALQTAAQVVSKISSAVFWGRNPFRHSSALLGYAVRGKRDASSRLCKLLESSKDLFGRWVSKQKTPPHLN